MNRIAHKLERDVCPAEGSKKETENIIISAEYSLKSTNSLHCDYNNNNCNLRRTLVQIIKGHRFGTMGFEMFYEFSGWVEWLTVCLAINGGHFNCFTSIGYASIFLQ